MDQNNIWGRKEDHQIVLKKLFVKYYKPLCKYLLQYTKDQNEAEDIVQGIFVDLWEKRNKLVIKQSMNAYLYRTAYNAFIDKTRRQKRKDALLDSLKYEALIENTEEDESLFQEKILRIKNEIEALPPRCKEILLLSKQENYKYHEIAAKLNISVKTVEAQMRLAFQKIKEGYSNKGFILFMMLKKFKFKSD